MNKRQFLAATLASAAIAPCAPIVFAKPAASGDGPALLTVTGAGIRQNRGPLDPALDQLMHKQKLQFDHAHAFDFAALSALPSHRINPVLEYDARAHLLAGPLLSDVIAAAMTKMPASPTLTLRAIDGYAVAVTMAEARKYAFIIATHLDGKPMPLGGLGPLWAIHDPARQAELANKPLNERFARCPWGLYHIDVGAG